MTGVLCLSCYIAVPISCSKGPFLGPTWIPMYCNLISNLGLDGNMRVFHIKLLYYLLSITIFNTLELRLIFKKIKGIALTISSPQAQLLQSLLPLELFEILFNSTITVRNN